MRYTTRSPAEAVAWQAEVRGRVSRLLKMEDLVASAEQIEPGPEEVSSQAHDAYLLREIELNSTSTRRMKAVLTLPRSTDGSCPAVVCIHGHGGTRHDVYDSTSIYCGFATALAERGCATIAVDVGQHEVYETGRTLMGERLWDLMRCVDHLTSLTSVDPARIGCAGLSLGGEMAMWLGAMDQRIKAAVSSGFLTRMDQMEQDHCMCWKFPGLRELVDYADIYSLMAPRALQCQNGLLEEPHGFTVPIARKALQEIQVIYEDFGQPENLDFVAHDGGHVIDLASLLAFLDRL
jgi:hypothetical protein